MLALISAETLMAASSSCSLTHNYLQFGKQDCYRHRQLNKTLIQMVQQLLPQLNIKLPTVQKKQRLSNTSQACPYQSAHTIFNKLNASVLMALSERLQSKPIHFLSSDKFPTKAFILLHCTPIHRQLFL